MSAGQGTGWGPPPGYFPGPAARPPLNRLAAASLACGIAQLLFGLFTGIPAIVLGHIARGQIRQSGESGSGMAIAGLIFGYFGTACTLIIGALLIYLLVVLHNTPYHTALG